MNAIPDQHLFTVRGRPVMFRKDEEGFGALYATERGDFPINHSGYEYLDQFTTDEAERIGFFNLLSERFLERLAAEKERKTNEVLRETNQCSRLDGRDQRVFIRCSQCASRAFAYGLFATDAQRWQLWQAAHETYSMLFESDFAWLVSEEDQSFVQHFEYGLQTFEALCECMHGEFTYEKARSHPFALSLLGYFELPPRPEGEPVISIPTETLMFDFDD